MINITPTLVPLRLNGGGDKTDTHLILTQNDNLVGRLQFQIINDDNSEINYSEINSAVMQIKIGQNTYLQPFVCDVNVDSVTVDLTNEMLSYTGLASCVLKLTSDNWQLHTTTQFYYIVQESLFGDDAEITDAQTSAVNSLIEYLSGKSTITVHDEGFKYENAEYVLNETAIYKANSDIAKDTAFAVGENANEWTKIADLGGGSATYPTGGTTGQALVKASNTDSDVEWATIAGGGATNTPMVVVAGTTPVQTIDPFKFYDFADTPTVLTITLGEQADTSIVSDYSFQFSSGEVATTLISITGVDWSGGVPTIQANKTYQAIITNGVGYIIEV